METVVFDPSIAELTKVVEATSKIVVSDLSDDGQIAAVHDARISLRDIRVRVQKYGKSLREDALKHQRAIIEREKELIAIISPEEERLSALEEEANAIKERAARAALLPIRREQLASIRDGLEESDETILSMDGNAFIVYFNERVAAKNERDRLNLEEERVKLNRDMEIAEAQKTAAAEAAEKVMTTLKLEAEAKEKAQADLEKKKKYQKWLMKIGYAKEEDGNWFFETKDGVVKAYKFVGEYK